MGFLWRRFLARPGKARFWAVSALSRAIRVDPPVSWAWMHSGLLFLQRFSSCAWRPASSGVSNCFRYSQCSLY